MRGRAWSNVALAAGSLVVFFGGFEAVVRLVGPDLEIPRAQQQFRFTQQFEFELPHHARDPVLGWRLVPGTYGRMRINRHGFRGRPVDDARPGERRIAHMGDSCTMGFTIGDDSQVYGAQLEARLRKQGLAARTFNFGVDGYSSFQGRLLLHEVLETLHPDYVTLYFGYNDHHWSNVADQDTPWRATAWQQTFEKSHSYRFVRRQLLRLLRQEVRLEQPLRRVALDDFESNLQDMVATAREAGVEVLLLTTPLRPHMPLVENEVPVVVDGKESWVTQEWWVSSQLLARGLAPEATGTPEWETVVREAMRLHPDWPWPHWLLAQELWRRGDPAGARAAVARCHELDQERRVVESYNDRVRRVGETTGATVVDLAATFPTDEPLFNDVVHPNPTGHRRIAKDLAQAIATLEAGMIPPAND